jgi:hypothetical protein
VRYHESKTLSTLLTFDRIPVKPSKNPLKVTIIDNNNAYLFALSPDLLNHYAPVLLSAAKTITSGLCYVNDIEAQTFRHVTKWLHHQPYFDCGSFDEKKVEEVDWDYDSEYYEQGLLHNDYEDATLLAAKIYLFASKYEIPTAPEGRYRSPRHAH